MHLYVHDSLCLVLIDALTLSMHLILSHILSSVCVLFSSLLILYCSFWQAHLPFSVTLKLKGVHANKNINFFYWKWLCFSLWIIWLLTIFNDCISSSGEKERNNERRNAGSITGHRGSNTDGSAVPMLARKPVVSGLSLPQATETSEMQHSNIIVISSPETSQPDTGKKYLYIICI